MDKAMANCQVCKVSVGAVFRGAIASGICPYCGGKLEVADGVASVMTCVNAIVSDISSILVASNAQVDANLIAGVLMRHLPKLATMENFPKLIPESPLKEIEPNLAKPQEKRVVANSGEKKIAKPITRAGEEIGADSIGAPADEDDVLNALAENEDVQNVEETSEGIMVDGVLLLGAKPSDERVSRLQDIASKTGNKGPKPISRAG